MKTRFTSLDIAASIASFRDSLIGLRVANVYDINPKCYLFKLAKPDKKEWLLIESGIRIHSTRFTREKNAIPSAFTLKLRKHLRTKRIEAIEQLGVDRVVKITFGTGPLTQHLIIEFYASGNVVLTDGDLVIQTVLRTHKYDDNTIVAPHNVYPLQTAKQMVPITEELLSQILSAEVPLTSKQDKEDEIQKEKNQPKSEISLKIILSNETDLGTLLIEHCLLKSGIDPQAKLRDYDKQQNAALLSELQAAQNIFLKKANTGEGYILLQQGKSKSSKKKPQSTEENNNSVQPELPETLFDDFMPILFLQYANRPHLKFSTFDEAIDEYFSKIESQKLTVQASQQEAAVLSKLEKVKKDQQRRIEELNKNEAQNRTKARLIELNLKEVDQVIQIIRSAVASSMDWTKLNEIIKEEKKKGDPTANMIHKLHLDKNQVTLYLTNPSDEISDEELASPALLVDIDLALSAHANATYYFDLKKKSNVKAKKTIDAAEQAVKAAEKKTRAALKEVKVKTEIKHARKPLWFEKFNWFITTDNYLVISGKDMQQNEQLYKKYLKKGDVYIHADLSGAASCIVKNPSNGVIPPSTLLQAGDFSVCHSAAWNEKIVTSAWWVEKDQVSKTAPTGEFLTTGSFMIRGKKNYLPPSNLILGFGIMFKLHEESLAKHRALKKQTQDSETTNNANINVIQEKEDDTELQVDETDSNDVESEKPIESVPATQPVVAESKPNEANQLHLRSLGFGVQHSDDIVSSDSTEDNTVGKKKRVSAKERRQMKKGLANSTEIQNNESNDIEAAKETSPEEKVKENSSKALMPRGKRSKEKKAKEKYKDQDEEERAMKMQLLGSVGKPQQEKQEKQPPKPTHKQSQNAPKKKQEPPKPKVSDTEQQTNEEEEVRNILKEENLDELDDEKDKSADIELLDSLTGTPLPDDILLFCVPVCGPYSAMNNFKYKVKLTPGSAKRGKAVKTILKFFLHNENITPQERDLIRNMPEQEAIQQIVGNVKISTPGLFAQTKKGKQD